MIVSWLTNAEQLSFDFLELFHLFRKLLVFFLELVDFGDDCGPAPLQAFDVLVDSVCCCRDLHHSTIVFGALVIVTFLFGFHGFTYCG